MIAEWFGAASGTELKAFYYLMPGLFRFSSWTTDVLLLLNFHFLAFYLGYWIRRTVFAGILAFVLGILEIRILNVAFWFHAISMNALQMTTRAEVRDFYHWLNWKIIIVCVIGLLSLRWFAPRYERLKGVKRLALISIAFLGLVLCAFKVGSEILSLRHYTETVFGQPTTQIRPPLK